MTYGRRRTSAKIGEANRRNPLRGRAAHRPDPAEILGDALDQLGEQFLPVADVPVNRGVRTPSVAARRTHAQRIQPFRLDDLQRGVETRSGVTASRTASEVTDEGSHDVGGRSSVRARRDLAPSMDLRC